MVLSTFPVTDFINITVFPLYSNCSYVILESSSLNFVAYSYSAYPLAKQQFELEENKEFNLTQVIGLTNEDPVSEEFRWVKQVV